MVMKLVKNDPKYYEFIRSLRTHYDNSNGFAEIVSINQSQQREYMRKHGSCYFICLNNLNKPVGWVGVVDNDIRVCVSHAEKKQGIGSFMINELSKTHPNAKAKVLVSNSASVALFKSCGFQEFSRDERFIYFQRFEYYKCMHNPYQIVRLFEEEVANYTNSPYAVSVDSCTNAIFLCLMYQRHLHTSVEEVTIPSKTYLSVPQSIMHAGFTPAFDSRLNSWSGIYPLSPFSIFDAAKRFTSDMYIKGSLMCLSFHIKKNLKINKGGMILTDDLNAVEWLKKARYEGRSEKLYRDDDVDTLGWNMYMPPQQAAHGLALMQNYPLVSPDQEEDSGYKDLTNFTLFKQCKRI